MDQLFNLLKGFAPAIATAVAGPLGGAAVSMIAKKFGVEDSVAAVAQAIAGDPKAEEKLRELDLEYAKLHLENVKGARDMQTAALAQSDVFSKRFIYYFAAFWSVCAVVYIGFITFATIPEQNVRFADTILGFLLGTIVATFMNFFYGTSKSSQDKTDKMAEMAKEMR
jgi:hypothetical protein